MYLARGHGGLACTFEAAEASATGLISRVADPSKTRWNTWKRVHAICTSLMRSAGLVGQFAGIPDVITLHAGLPPPASFPLAGLQLTTVQPVPQGMYAYCQNHLSLNLIIHPPCLASFANCCRARGAAWFAYSQHCNRC